MQIGQGSCLRCIARNMVAKVFADLAEAVANGTRKEFMDGLTSVPLLIIDDFGMRKLPSHARYERASTLLTSNRPVEDWGKLLGDVAAVGSMLDRCCIMVTCSSAALRAGARRRCPRVEPRQNRKRGFL
jgi:DNA replication protein DnaC